MNCAQGYPVVNRHNNCPYSMICATCDMDDEAVPPHPSDDFLRWAQQAADRMTDA